MLSLPRAVEASFMCASSGTVYDSQCLHTLPKLTRSHLCVPVQEQFATVSYTTQADQASFMCASSGTVCDSQCLHTLPKLTRQE